jgi:hypothetical protein
MKGFKAVASMAVLSALWSTAPAHAIPVTDFVNPTDTIIGLGSTPSPCPVGFTCTTSSLSFVHNLTDNGFAPGDLITSATVAIHLTDENGSEGFKLLIGLTQTEIAANVPTNSTDTYTLSVGSLADLQADGTIPIQITITSANNNQSFNFADSTLTAQVSARETRIAAVPEPATTLLLGCGLLGLGFVRRKSA